MERIDVENVFVEGAEVLLVGWVGCAREGQQRLAAKSALERSRRIFADAGPSSAQCGERFPRRRLRSLPVITAANLSAAPAAPRRPDGAVQRRSRPKALRHKQVDCDRGRCTQPLLLRRKLLVFHANVMPGSCRDEESCPQVILDKTDYTIRKWCLQTSPSDPMYSSDRGARRGSPDRRIQTAT